VPNVHRAGSPHRRPLAIGASIVRDHGSGPAAPAISLLRPGSSSCGHLERLRLRDGSGRPGDTVTLGALPRPVPPTPRSTSSRPTSCSWWPPWPWSSWRLAQRPLLAPRRGDGFAARRDAPERVPIGAFADGRSGYGPARSWGLALRPAGWSPSRLFVLRPPESARLPHRRPVSAPAPRQAAASPSPSPVTKPGHREKSRPFVAKLASLTSRRVCAINRRRPRHPRLRGGLRIGRHGFPAARSRSTRTFDRRVGLEAVHGGRDPASRAGNTGSSLDDDIRTVRARSCHTTARSVACGVNLVYHLSGTRGARSPPSMPAGFPRR